MGFDKLIDFIIEFITDFLPVFTVKVYQRAVVLRNGKIHRTKDQGLYFKIPFIDNPIIYEVVTTTIETDSQTIPTKDGKEITTHGVVKYHISDIISHTTEIFDASDAIIDITEGHIMREINCRDYADIVDTILLSNEITKKVRNDVKKYGIYIEQYTITNMVQTRNYRLFGVGN